MPKIDSPRKSRWLSILEISVFNEVVASSIDEARLWVSSEKCLRKSVCARAQKNTTIVIFNGTKNKTKPLTSLPFTYTSVNERARATPVTVRMVSSGS